MNSALHSGLANEHLRNANLVLDELSLKVDMLHESSRDPPSLHGIPPVLPHRRAPGACKLTSAARLARAFLFQIHRAHLPHVLRQRVDPDHLVSTEKKLCGIERDGTGGGYKLEFQDGTATAADIGRPSGATASRCLRLGHPTTLMRRCDSFKTCRKPRTDRITAQTSYGTGKMASADMAEDEWTTTFDPDVLRERMKWVVEY
ncbi:salicylate hydroxylase [Diplodia corticola]|uniref:Salicylate hydroxylase n=1 Tax=Diplodia corticola TaxID=236234 RepID=A0A1J9QST6_9PEZI|nr:salicylate hydroxylase [Diplodia corticola]OJD31050.1 salicylate hydroxylase [Diplodia corticola]